jgi:Cysteine-rich secretory protein family
VQNFGPECPIDGTEIVRLTPERKAAILKLHNTKRSMIASGQLNGFGKAVQMPQLQWDEQLAYLAQLNAKKCVLAHDECHNTRK